MPATRVEELMTAVVVTASASQTAKQVRDSMIRNGISSLPVVDAAGILEGIITSRDILGASDLEAPITGLLSPAVFTVTPGEDAWYVAETMIANHLHHVVVTEDQKVVGIVSSYDLLPLVKRDT